jgi:hypothetical protein
VEGVGRVAAVGGGVGERADDVQELDDRAGPAVGQDQGQGVGFGGADVEEVDVLPVDGGGELGELVEPGLLLGPVVAVGPVPGQLFQVAEGHPAGPADAGQLIRPAGAGKPVTEVVQVGLGDVDPEGSDLGVGVGSAGHGGGSFPPGVANLDAS